MNYANDYCGYGNEVLYRMCNERPLHNDVDTIESKLWIIGRSYAAAIERKAGVNFNSRDAAKKISKSNLDSYISRIRSIDRIYEDNINELLATHKFFTDLLRECTGIEKRSLASKYLHFHAPKAVFIYDSIANKEIRKKLKENDVKQKFPLTKKHDDEYEAFVLRCIFYRDNFFEAEIGALATPRRIDIALSPYGQYF